MYIGKARHKLNSSKNDWGKPFKDDQAMVWTLVQLFYENNLPAVQKTEEK